MATKREAPPSEAPKMKRMKFAEKMMAKMGHVKGEGLGREGQGIINPIDVKLRPQGAGVGVVKEKTAQAKAEAKRAAEQRGEEYVDSSEEERRQKKIQRAAKKSNLNSKTGTAQRRPKYRTVTEIETEEGLEIPNIFKTLINQTGQEIERLTLMPNIVPAQPVTEAEKLAKLARLDLEAFADHWRGIQDRKTYASLLEDQLSQDLSRQVHDQALVQKLSEVVESFKNLEIYQSNVPETSTFDLNQVDALSSKLLELKTSNRINVEEACVAVIGTAFAKAMTAWKPLEESTDLLECLKRLKVFLVQSNESRNEDDNDTNEGLASPYESLLRQQWLPKMRRVVINDWDPENPSLLSMVLQWRQILTPSVEYAFINGIVVRKLQEKLKGWKPHSHDKNKGMNGPLIWLAPWLSLLDDYHLDSNSASGLLSQFRRKIRAALDSWNLKNALGAVQVLQPWQDTPMVWRQINRDLELRVLPRLATYLRDSFEVSPTDQDKFEPILSHVLEWQPLFKTEKFARVFVDAFFPKWHHVLYLWLTHQPDYEEISKWIQWWRYDRLKSLIAVPAIDAEWLKGLEFANKASELGPDRTRAELQMPELSGAKEQKTDEERSPSPKKVPEQEELSMRDLVEEKCEEESLILKPMREADPKTGQPLFRISASASGAGGIVVKFQGDLVFARRKRDRERWEAFDPFEDDVLSTMVTAK